MILFIVSHVGSGSSILCNALSEYHYTSRLPPRNSYSDPQEILKYQLDNKEIKIHFDEILFNFQFSNRSFYNFAKFIYVVREAKPSLECMEGYSLAKAVDYYCFRLRRMCEMAKRTPNSLLLTWEDLLSGRAVPFVSEELGLGKDIVFDIKDYKSKFIPHEFVNKAQSRYENHLLYLRSQLTAV